MIDLVVIVIAIVGCVGNKKVGVTCLCLIGVLLVGRLVICGL